MSSENNQWLTITQFADNLGLSRYIVEGLVKTGKLRVFNISPGRKRATYRLPKSQLSEALTLMRTSVYPESHGGDDGGTSAPAVEYGTQEEATVRNE